jgi:hypothetical protein
MLNALTKTQLFHSQDNDSEQCNSHLTLVVKKLTHSQNINKISKLWIHMTMMEMMMMMMMMMMMIMISSDDDDDNDDDDNCRVGDSAVFCTGMGSPFGRSLPILFVG